MDFKYLLVIVLQILGFTIICIKLYAKSYVNEKGKNLATKEDIGEITQIVESIKTSLTIKTEELKSDLLYKNEHLIHLRAAERAAIINFYKTTWVLILNFTRTDFTKYEIDSFGNTVDDAGNELETFSRTDEISNPQYFRYTSEIETSLNKTKEELSNLKYLKDISESELMFFYSASELIAITSEFNLALAALERTMISAINQLLQVSKESTVKVNSGASINDTIIELKRKRSDILANWHENRRNTSSLIRSFNENLKKVLFERLNSLTN